MNACSTCMYSSECCALGIFREGDNACNAWIEKDIYQPSEAEELRDALAEANELIASLQAQLAEVKAQLKTANLRRWQAEQVDTEL